ncbi:MAG: hypothetical protein JSR82_14645 [Verrucomicrobia bacterium]|nr:hypothetical protein [Verrucomicrobiota bacterium]
MEISTQTGLPGRRMLGAIAGALAVFWLQPVAQGQELQRNSLVSAQNAAAAKLSSEENNYNLKVGPVRFLMSAFAGFEFNDNIGLSERNRIADFAVRFGIDLRAIWQITRLNALSIDIGIGFQRYVNNPDVIKGNLTIAPNSQIGFDVYIADVVRLNFHDRFEIRQDPIDGVTLSNLLNFGRFLNTAGVTMVADLNTVVITAGYDHFNWVSLNREFDYLERADEQFTASVMYQIVPRTFVGVEGTYSISNYRQNVLNDSRGFSIGGYLDWAVSPYLRLVARAGFEHRNFSGNVVNGFGGGLYRDGSNLDGWYASINIQHRINAYLSQNLSAGRTNELGYTSNYNQLYYVRYSIDWRANSRLAIGLSTFYEAVQTSGGLLDEDLTRWGAGVSATYQLGLRMTGAVRYNFVTKDSNRPLQDYYQNRLTVDFNYRF